MNPQQYATYNPQQQQQLYSHSRTNSGMLPGNQFATVSGVNAMSSSPMTSMGPMAGMAPHIAMGSGNLSNWTPNHPQELQYFEHLFAVADEEKRNAIGGRQAVLFFTKSNVDKNKLREIWNIAAGQKSELARNDFFVAMRLISMAQRGEMISAQRFMELASSPFPLPVLEGIPPPPQQAPQQQQPQQPQPPHRTSMGGGYSITDEERAKYQAIFRQYDADNDGFLLGSEAVGLFQMSGLDRNVLREIWTLADRTQDSRLDVNEFYVAMHLIVCISKRGLPLPSSLPAELVETAFQAKPDAFGSLNAPTSAPAPASASVPVPPAPVTAPTAATGKTGMDAFDDIDGGSGSTDSAMAPTPTSGPAAPVPTAAPPTPSSMAALVPPSPEAHVVTPSSQTRADRTSSGGSTSSGHFQAINPNLMAQQRQASGHLMGMYPNMPQGMAVAPGMAPVATAPKPFLSEEEDQKAVKVLEQRNEELVNQLASVERKQLALEQVAEKIRELDQLRHELVTLTQKRDKLKANQNQASSSLGASSSASHCVNQIQQVVEQNLVQMIENEKKMVSRLQNDVTQYEKLLQQQPQPSASDEGFTQLPLASPSQSNSSAGMGGGGGGSASGFDEFGAFESSTPTFSPAAVASSDQTPTSQTNSQGFDAFSELHF